MRMGWKYFFLVTLFIQIKKFDGFTVFLSTFIRFLIYFPFLQIIYLFFEFVKRQNIFVQYLFFFESFYCWFIAEEDCLFRATIRNASIRPWIYFVDYPTPTIYLWYHFRCWQNNQIKCKNVLVNGNYVEPTEWIGRPRRPKTKTNSAHSKFPVNSKTIIE